MVSLKNAYIVEDSVKWKRKMHRIKKQFLKLNPTLKEKDLLWRADGRLEWLCKKHGCGHTVYVPWPYADDPAWWVHGRCGCCKGIKVVK